MYWHVFFPHLILRVKTRIIFKAPNEVCKQTTSRHVKRSLRAGSLVSTFRHRREEWGDENRPILLAGSRFPCLQVSLLAGYVKRDEDCREDTAHVSVVALARQKPIMISIVSI